MRFIFQKENALPLVHGANRASDVPAADWLSQTHVKNCCNFVMFGDTFFFLMVRIPLKHSSLYNK